MSGAVPPPVSESAPNSPNPGGRNRPRLVKTDRVTDLRSSPGSTKLPSRMTRSSGTVKVLRPSPQSSPRSKDSEADEGTICEENGITFLVKSPRRSRTLADVTPANLEAAANKSDSPRAEVTSSGKRIQKFVHAGTFENLVGLLVVKPLKDPRFKNEFLLGLPWFSSPMQVLEQLTKIYADQGIPDSTHVRSRIVDIINDWIDNNFRYFLIERPNLTALLKFLDETLVAVHSKHRDMMRRIINYKIAGINPQDLLAVAVQMKSTKSGLGASKLFGGAEAVSWLRKSRNNISENAASEILTQLLRDNLIIVRDDGGGNDGAANGSVRITEAFSKTAKYSFAVSKEDEQRKTVESLLPIFLSKPLTSGSRFSSFHPDVFAKQLAIFEQSTLMFHRFCYVI